MTVIGWFPQKQSLRQAFESRLIPGREEGEKGIRPDKAEFTDMSIFLFYRIFILAKTSGASAKDC